MDPYNNPFPDNPSPDFFLQYQKFLEWQKQNGQIPTQSSQFIMPHSQSSQNFVPATQISQYGQNIYSQAQPGLPQITTQQPQYQNPHNIYQEPYPSFSSQIASYNQNDKSENTNDDENDVGEPQDEEEECVVETLSSSKKPTKKRASNKNNFNKSEDEALISSFIRVATDSIVGTNQRNTALWRKVRVEYDSARVENSNLRERTQGMLNSRFRRISKAVMKFVACYEEAIRLNSSGYNDDDILARAHLLYDGTFTFEHAWILLKNYPKYKEVIALYGSEGNKSQEENFRTQYRDTTTLSDQSDPDSGGSGKRSRLYEASDDNEEAEVVRRPPGREVSKNKRGKGKMGVGNFAYMAEELSEKIVSYGERATGNLELQWERLNFSKAKEAKRQAEMEKREARRLMELEAQERKAQNDALNYKRGLLQSLLNASNLDPDEQALKKKLVRELSQC